MGDFLEQWDICYICICYVILRLNSYFFEI